MWAGRGGFSPLALSEVQALRGFLRVGGLVVVDDSEPLGGRFGRAARRELLRVLPDSAPVRLDSSHVIYKSYYLLKRPVGRVLGPPYVEAIVRAGLAQVIFLAHDLLGALARNAESWAHPVEPGGSEQREQAIRLAVNLAMFALCSDYKDDQVHASWLMRRRASLRP